ncbi:MAG: hypothetical protein LBS52_09615 [Dysgonamonadaceae bacterium]|nr:hypothetical protein [Dysgonamonadaceae bacterium]
MKNIVKAIILFAVIITTCPASKAQEQASASDDAAALRQQVEMLSLKVDSLTSALQNVTEPIENNAKVSASDTEIKLNFNFKDNKATFTKALNILGIGFATVFVVMIVFIFVSTQIDKLLPYNEED